MRNYESLHIDVKDATAAREVEKNLPERYKTAGGAIFLTNPSYSYSFDPVLTKEEIAGLVTKLIELDVKSFTFQDTASLGRDD